ncbi:WD40/YVTN/BNR-like repeat-containing protein [Epilithonimonas sp. UC225_85]|uniref:WD40/YVTN/BNR-like repeat-containing protein n=1 Tax=Epilithonimonas sp. UC225_85 TaxID=3350167 RepID=UPI0036D28EF5
MKKLSFLFLLISTFFYSQKFTIDTLLTDKISIRAIQLWDGKVWYSGTDSKFGFVNLKDKSDKKQIIISDKKLQFRTLAQNKKNFYAISIESPAYFFEIDKSTLKSKIIYSDTIKTAFYDALHFVNEDLAFAFSDPAKDLHIKLLTLSPTKKIYKFYNMSSANRILKMNEGEAAFAASNSNLASFDNYLWLGTGGGSSRIFRFDLKSQETEIFETNFIQDSEAQGIYSIDFYDKNFGIAVGGDYTKQADNINNIATTNDGGKTWQIQASGKNAGYMTCVKFRPKTKGKEIVAVGDKHISFSSDFGKTWTKISDEKNLYACEWADKNTLILAGKDKIIRLTFL